MKGTGKTKISKSNVALIVLIAIIFAVAFAVIYLGKRAGIRAVAQIELTSEYQQRLESMKNAAVEALTKRDQQIESLHKQDSVKNADLEKSARLINNLKNQIRNRDEKIDSLHAVINSIRQSDI